MGLKWFVQSSVYGPSSSTKKAKVIRNNQEISEATWTGGKAVAPTLRRLAPVPTSWVLCGARAVRHTCRNHTSHIVSLAKKVKRFAKSEPLHYHQLASLTFVFKRKLALFASSRASSGGAHRDARPVSSQWHLHCHYHHYRHHHHTYHHHHWYMPHSLRTHSYSNWHPLENATQRSSLFHISSHPDIQQAHYSHLFCNRFQSNYNVKQ